MITDADLAAATEVRTYYGWFEFHSITAETVTVVGNFFDYRVPKSTIREVRK